MIKNRIKVLRAEKDMTQEELAEKTQVTRQTIIAIEKNKYAPSLGLAFKIAKVFRVSLIEVFYEEAKWKRLFWGLREVSLKNGCFTTSGFINIDGNGMDITNGTTNKEVVEKLIQQGVEVIYMGGNFVD